MFQGLKKNYIRTFKFQVRGAGELGWVTTQDIEEVRGIIDPNPSRPLRILKDCSYTGIIP